ncbi:heterokaryon incompatibility protein-domain-containing protein [Nemania sp. FL0031]|nr:heterokaryon incompatibility protein-domain-containing protein [Nemania sp. FL0031]
MPSIIKEHISTCTELHQVQDHCPERPYVELMIPRDARNIVSVTFTTVSRDQGWADDGGFSYSWFDGIVQRRTSGHTDLPVYTICGNRTANPEFFKQETCWDYQSGTRKRLWVEALQAGDIIGILPRAMYPARVNILREASIKIQYETYEEGENKNTAPKEDKKGFYERPVKTNSYEIRVLVVEPGSYDDPIHCRFDYITLIEDGSNGSPPEFDALSYCWNVSPGDSYILLDPNFHTGGDVPWIGRKFDVGQNVETGLRRLRQKDKAIRIWIDAICINQKDLEERAQQVSIMGMIYSQATTVHIWLGEGNVLVDVALRVVHELFNFAYGSCPGAESCHCADDGISKHGVSTQDAEVKRPPEGVRSISNTAITNFWGLIKRNYSSQLSEIGDDWWTGEISAMVGGLYQHPWFTRVWVLQEAILARRAFIHSGAEVILFKEVISMSNLFLEIRSTPGWWAHIKWRPALAPIWGRLGKSTPALTEESESQVSPGAETKGPGDAGSEIKRPFGILDVFIDGLVMRATDPRDKLFALLPFAYELSNQKEKDEHRLELARLIRPNYTKPTAAVFADFTRWWIQTHKSLAIFSYIHADPARSWRRMRNQRQSTESASDSLNQSQHPTWTIGADGRASWASATLESQFSFRATGTTTPRLSLQSIDEESNNGPQYLTLKLEGLQVTTITKIGHFPIETFFPYGSEDAMNGDDETGPGRRQNIRAVFHKIIDPCGMQPFWTLEADPIENLRTDVSAARSFYSDHLRTHWAYCPRDNLTALAPPSEDNKGEDGGTGGPKLYQTHKLPTCLDPCFFVATGGHYGLCPWTAREGDIVVLLYGGNVPYLLRPVDEEGHSGGTKDLFELVGECYVQGIMNGEFLDKKNDGSDQQAVTRTFTLV